MSVIDQTTTTPRHGALGTSPTRPDGVEKVQGTYAFSSDISADGCLFGVTLRSPHPYARILSIDLSAAWKIDGVQAIVTADDVPGQLTYGLISQDQPVFASDVVRYVGEPVAALAADDPEVARRGMEAIVVEYEVLTPLLDADEAISGKRDPIHPDGNVIRHQRIVHGDAAATGDVVIEGTYEIGMQDQAFLGLEAALALPDSGGKGIELHVATQWLHEDRHQIAACLGFDEENVRLVLGGVGGAFGAREDISLQVHCCLLALRVSRPVRMAYSRGESFLGHVHRPPCIDLDAPPRHRRRRDRQDRIEDGLRRGSVRVDLVSGADQCDHVGAGVHTAVQTRWVDGWAVRTNHLPCGAMRGFGAVQACFAYESQMDKLAAACGIDPFDIRLRNAMTTGDTLITGQPVLNVAPVEECLRATSALPLPDEPVGGLLLPDGSQDAMKLPGGAGRTADAADVVRGIGWGASIKNLMYSEAFDDYATARCRLVDSPDGVHVHLKFATSEVGQGFVTLAPQIARTVLGIDAVVIDPIDTQVGSAGSTSASRQTWMSGGAVNKACGVVRDLVFEQVAAANGWDALGLFIDGTDIVDPTSGSRLDAAGACAGLDIDETVEYRHPPTTEIDENGSGQSPHRVRLRCPPGSR